MKKAMIKVLSLAMALTLVASLAACGGKGDGETTAPADTTVADGVTPDADESTPADVSGEESSSEEATVTEIVTDANGNTQVVVETKAPNAPTKAPANPGTPNTPADKTSLTNEEAVALFNKATVGKTKAGQRYTKVNLSELTGSLSSLKGTIEKNLPDPNKPTAVSKPANSTMSVSDFSSISAKKSGNNWVITMKLKDGTAPAAKAFDELPQDEINKYLNMLQAKPVENVKFIYNNGTIVATVTPDGTLVNATYTMNVTVDVKDVTALLVVKVPSAKVSVTQTDKF